MTLRWATILSTAWVLGSLPAACPADPKPDELLQVRAAGFTAGTSSSVSSEAGGVRLEVVPAGEPFAQSAVKQSTDAAKLGPDPAVPYFTVRFAMPIPPENATAEVAAVTGIDPMVFTHNHSPGFEILPNGDALAIYFSTPPGKSEADPSTCFVQCRLRYGSDQWDMPELFFKTEGHNDQSGLLWNDGGKLWFFGGGRGISDSVPFRLATSADNGVTWTLSLPQLERPATNYAAQPITSAFRGADGAVYFAMDGKGASSFLWRSTDGGVHWQDMGGRTGGRHSAVVPVDDRGGLLAIGGKNAQVNGFSPQSTSGDYGATWSDKVASPFPQLGSGQRPSLIRLASGRLLFVSDAWLLKKNVAPPAEWTHGDGPFVALSDDSGKTWRVKPLPVRLPKHGTVGHGTVGYVTARQGANGVIHILTTETQPCLHYEMNEAWILSDAGDVAPETGAGEVKAFSETYPDGKVRCRWTARVCPQGRYLLDGKETDFYPSGAVQHEVTYAAGRKTGQETYFSPAGRVAWSWAHTREANESVWTRYWENGQKKSESTWLTEAKAGDAERRFSGWVAEGPARRWSQAGALESTTIFHNGETGESKATTKEDAPGEADK